jgi:hypothetical protein
MQIFARTLTKVSAIFDLCDTNKEIPWQRTNVFAGKKCRFSIDESITNFGVRVSENRWKSFTCSIVQVPLEIHLYVSEIKDFDGIIWTDIKSFRRVNCNV